MIFIGIDPGANKAAFASCIQNGGNIRRTVVECPLHNLKAELKKEMDDYGYYPFPGEKIIVFIEHMKGYWPFARAHQSHVKQIKKIIRELWPRKNEIYSIDPEVWQAGMISGLIGDTKVRSMARARLDGFSPRSHNEADAINILNYGIANYSMLKRAVDFTKMIIKTAKGGKGK